MSKIKEIKAGEILDSRGNPTLEVRVTLDSGDMGITSVPSGASTGKYEALELRDGNPERYEGMGVLKAVKNINTIISEKLIGAEAENQKEIDSVLINLDGTPNKSKLGANAILGVSLAVCRAATKASNLPLYDYLRQLSAISNQQSAFPIPMFNILNGGVHASNKLSIQEFMIVPKFDSFALNLEAGSEIYHNLKAVLKEKGLGSGIGDEGGFAPHLDKNTEAIELILEAIKKAGFKAGKNVLLALDIASTQFYKNGKYSLNGDRLIAEDLISLYIQWTAYYPIISIEDGLAEDDWGGWKILTEKLGDKIMLVGDDLFVTQTNRLSRGINEKSANGLIIKPNQVGTLSETLATIKMAHDAGYKIIISHRSGETNDDFIADLAVGVGAPYIKAGAPARSERLAKYNRLLEIEEEINKN